MTNFYTPTTCKQLEQLGCVASGGMWEVIHPNKTVMVMRVDEGQGEANLLSAGYRLTKLFGNHDFLSSSEAKNNLVKVFGEEPTHWKTGHTEKSYGEHLRQPIIGLDEDSIGEIWSDYVNSGATIPAFEYQAHVLLDHIFSGGDGESFIKEALEAHGE